MKLHKLALATFMATAAMAAHAEITVSPMIGYHVFDNDNAKDIENTIEGSLALGYRINPNVGLELRYGLANANDETTDTLDVRNEMATLDTYYRFNVANKLQPYVLIGGGLQRTTGLTGVNNGYVEHTIANVAVGAFYEMADNLALRAELRGVEDMQESDHDGIASVGVTYSFGGQKAAAVAPVAAAAAVAVKTDGDDDKDGVANSADKCPGTPTNVVVTADGCTKELVETVSREMRVLFDTDKSVVKPEFHDEIEGIAKLLKEYPAATVEIQGHTDSRGTASYNDALSQRRADAIANVLTKTYGLSADRISSKGYGAAQPVADNKTAEGRAKNRRSVAVAQGEVKVTVKK
jgi:OOP family OmpA-OmpF porin